MTTPPTDLDGEAQRAAPSSAVNTPPAELELLAEADTPAATVQPPATPIDAEPQPIRGDVGGVAPPATPLAISREPDAVTGGVDAPMTPLAIEPETATTPAAIAAPVTVLYLASNLWHPIETADQPLAQHVGVELFVGGNARARGPGPRYARAAAGSATFAFGPMPVRVSLSVGHHAAGEVVITARSVTLFVGAHGSLAAPGPRIVRGRAGESAILAAGNAPVRMTAGMSTEVDVA